MKNNFVVLKKEERDNSITYKALMAALEFFESEDETVWHGDYGHPTTKWYDADGNIVAELDHYDGEMIVHYKYEEIEED